MAWILIGYNKILSSVDYIDILSEVCVFEYREINLTGHFFKLFGILKNACSI